MATSRPIKTSMRSDPRFSDLDITEKAVVLYAFTNERTELCGVYNITLKKMSFETWFTQEELLKLFDRLSKKWILDFNNELNCLAVHIFYSYQSITDPSIKLWITRWLDNLDKKSQEWLMQTAYTPPPRLPPDSVYLTLLNSTLLNSTLPKKIQSEELENKILEEVKKEEEELENKNTLPNGNSTGITNPPLASTPHKKKELVSEPEKVIEELKSWWRLDYKFPNIDEQWLKIEILSMFDWAKSKKREIKVRKTFIDNWYTDKTTNTRKYYKKLEVKKSIEIDYFAVRQDYK